MTIAPSSKVITFIHTRDRAKAKAFYGGVLGFALVSDDPFASVITPRIRTRCWAGKSRHRGCDQGAARR